MVQRSFRDALTVKGIIYSGTVNYNGKILTATEKRTATTEALRHRERIRF
jgi:hypothetical protein